MPPFQRLEHLPVLAEIHIVGNLGGVVDVHDVHGVLLVVFKLALVDKLFITAMPKPNLQAARSAEPSCKTKMRLTNSAIEPSVASAASRCGECPTAGIIVTSTGQ